MKKGYKSLLTIVAGMCFAIFVPAQELPVFPGDPSLTHAVLPNGMNCYVVENHATAGVADFALVQRTGTGNVPGEGKDVSDAAKNALAGLPRLGGTSALKFLASIGAEHGPEGLLDVTSDATVFRFEDVDLGYSASVLDSALLVIMDLADRGSFTDDGFVRKWYAPSDQAVIVCGDVSASSVKDKLTMMSYMIPARDTSARLTPQWHAVDTASVSVTTDTSLALCVVTASWSTPRISKDYLATVQPAITSLFMEELGQVACARFAKAMKGEGLPVTGLRYEYSGVAQSLVKEDFIMKYSVRPDHLDRSLELFSSVMSSLDAGTAVSEEVEWACAESIRTFRERLSERTSSDAVDRCISSFLYGTPVVSEDDVFRFQSQHRLDADKALPLFNGIASALLDKERNLRISIVSPEMKEAGSIKNLFLEAWDTPYTLSQNIPSAESVLAAPDPEAKTKIKSAKRESMAGGTVIQMANGMTVICRKMPAGQRVYYSMILNGGYAAVPGLAEDEGAYMENYLSSSCFASLSSEEFQKMLAARGMTMDFDIDMAVTEIKGSVAKDDISLLLSVLAACLSEHQPDEEAFRYDLDCISLENERLEGTFDDRMAAVEKILSPGYLYSARKTVADLSEGFVQRAESFVSDRFRSADDGVLILVGDLDEAELKKQLTAYASEFPTFGGKKLAKPSVRFHTISGVSTYIVDGEEESVDLAMSARLPLTTENHVASQMAVMVMRQRLGEMFAGTGWGVEVRSSFTLFPEERFNVVVTLSPIRPDNLPSGTEALSPVDAMFRLRTLMSEASSEPVKEEHLAAYKAILRSEASANRLTPDYWIEILKGRYVFAKDLHTGTDARIDEVDSEKIMQLFSLLENSGKVEYIVNR